MTLLIPFARQERGFRFPRRDSARPLQGIVLHETAGPSAASALNTWRGQAIGAHLLIDVDGNVIQCADLLGEAPWHASGWSPHHIGIEVVCPVTDRSPYGTPGGPWPEPWASAPRFKEWRMNGIDKRLGPGLYVPPLPEQLGALVTVVDWLRTNLAGLADCRILSLEEGLMADRTPRAGIVAHAQVSVNKRGLPDKTDGIGPLRHLAGYDAFRDRFALGTP